MSVLDSILENSFIPIYGITTLVALWRYRRYFDTPYKYLPVILMYTFLTELLGMLIYTYDEFDFILSDLYKFNNWIVYNVYSIIFFLYFYHLYWRMIRDEKSKRFVLYGVGAFAIASAINPFIADFDTRFQMLAYFVGAFVLLCCILMYAKDLYRREKRYFLASNLMSWLGLGMFIFYVGYLPIILIGYYDLIESEAATVFMRRFHLSLILAMYICFIIGFIRMSRRAAR